MLSPRKLFNQLPLGSLGPLGARTESRLKCGSARGGAPEERRVARHASASRPLREEDQADDLGDWVLKGFRDELCSELARWTAACTFGGRPHFQHHPKQCSKPCHARDLINMQVFLTST